MAVLCHNGEETSTFAGMQYHSFSFADTGRFSRLITDYLAGKESLRPFYKYLPDGNSFGQIIDEKSHQRVDRDLLAQVLREQYSSLPDAAAVQRNIEALSKENTFTIVTAHQPVIGTGPLYMIIKVLCAINLAERLTANYPDQQFVPVFWMGGEDHDLAEMNHLHVFGKRVAWQTAQTGPVGRMRTHDMDGWLDDLSAILGSSPQAISWMDKLTAAYQHYDTVGEATFQLFHSLFASEGLVIIQPDHPALKRAFIPAMEEELFTRASASLVAPQVEKLEALGYHGQASPREINLFYLLDGVRERIVWIPEKDRYEVLNTDYKFNTDTLRAELYDHPERFSPNVILRPLYQEWLLPNLAYVGGGGEIAYWMQYRPLFEHYRVNFPMLVVRNSIAWLDKSSARKLQQFGFSLIDLFGDEEELIKRFVQEQTTEELTLSEEKMEIARIFSLVLDKAKTIDPTMEAPVRGEEQKVINSLEKLEAKLLRAEKQKYDQSVSQIRHLLGKLFPDGSLQERYENIAQYWIKHGATFLPILKEAIRPLEDQFVVIEEE